MPVLMSWAARMVAQREAALAPAVRERLDLHILDAIGALIAGHGTSEGQRILSFARAEGARPAFLSDDVLDRIVTRVALVRHTEIDDIDIASCVTAGAVAIPVALTLAERHETPPDVVANAILASYRVMTDLGRACGGSHLLARGFWPTYLAAPIGAAAAAATVFRLHEGATANAMAVALAQTAAAPGGPAEPNPRWLLLGLAARCGVVAALAAARGVPGDPTLLDGDWLARCHGIELQHQLLEPDADDVMAGMSMKAFVSAKQATCAVNAFDELLAEHAVEPASIDAVRAYVMPEHVRMIGHDRVELSRSARLTSLPHLMALAAHAPEQLMDVERALSDTPAIASLRARIAVAGDPDLARHGRHCWPARVELELADGRRLSKTVLQARGDPGRRLSLAQVQAKFSAVTRNAPPAAGHQAATRWLGLAGCNSSWR